jgi:hypothetical protein
MEVAVKEFVVVVGLYEFHHDHVSRTRMPTLQAKWTNLFQRVLHE